MRAGTCSGKGGIEVLQHSHDVLAVAFRPDGKLLASATLDAQIHLWNPMEAELQVPACWGPLFALSRAPSHAWQAATRSLRVHM